MPIDFTSLGNQASDFLKSDGFKKTIPYLLSGSAGALAGGIATGKRRASQGESRGAHLRRVLGNALLTGGLAGGAHYGLKKGWESTVGSMNKDKLMTGGDEVDGPATALVKNVSFGAPAAIAAGGGALALTDRMKGIGAGRDAQSKALKDFKRLTGDPDAHRRSPREIARMTSKGSTVKDIEAMIDAGDDHQKIWKAIDDGNVRESTRRAAGLASKDESKLMQFMRKRMGTLGQTMPRRAMRGGLALTAASLPALFGAFATNKSDAPAA